MTIALAAENGVPDWVQLFPAGPEIVARDGRVWFMRDPQIVLAAFEENAAPLPIDYEHAQAHRAPEGEEAPAAGWIDKLEVRNGEIWGHVEWTERAAKMIRDREYRFLSPDFLVLKEDETIVALSGAGLVNRPALHLQALARRSKGAPLQETTMNKALCRRLGLAEGASEEVIIAAIDKRDKDHETALTAAKTDIEKFVPRADYDKIKSELESVQASRAKEEADKRTAELDAAIEDAVKGGKIAPASRDHYRELCKAEGGLDKFNKLVGTLPVIAANTSLDTDPGTGEEDPNPAATARELAAKAVAYQKGQADLGITITTAQAVAAVQAGAKTGGAA